MSMRGALRSIAAAQRLAERESLKRKRELERQLTQLDKLHEIEQAAFEVEVFENYIDIITSLHKDSGKRWDWEELVLSKPPTKPERFTKNEISARSTLETYEPRFMDKILKRDESERAGLEEKITLGKLKDETEYNEAYKKYKQQYANWQLITNLAKKILNGDEGAYIEAINQIDPLNEICQLGSKIYFQTHGTKLIEATIIVNGEEIIPKKVKTQLKSGKLSEKAMSKTKFYELYQDYICGVVLRIARELFVLLPIEITIVTAIGKLLNTSTGYLEDQPILSVIIPRDTLIQLNFQMLDPSDSMSNFVHNMKLIKTKGFQPIQKLSISDIKLP